MLTAAERSSAYPDTPVVPDVAAEKGIGRAARIRSEPTTRVQQHVGRGYLLGYQISAYYRRPRATRAGVNPYLPTGNSRAPWRRLRLPSLCHSATLRTAPDQRHIEGSMT